MQLYTLKCIKYTYFICIKNVLDTSILTHLMQKGLKLIHSKLKALLNVYLKLLYFKAQCLKHGLVVLR